MIIFELYNTSKYNRSMFKNVTYSDKPLTLRIFCYTLVLILRKQMPIVTPKDFPANKTLIEDNVFLINDLQAKTQDIRPLNIVILNLMPTKIQTETQLIRLLSNTPLQINITFLKTKSYTSKNISSEHLDKFYKTFEDIKDNKYDGMIITGAPVERLDFEDVKYWDELVEIMEYTKENVSSTLHICWSAQAALYHHYGIEKKLLDKKISGIYKHKRERKNVELLRGIEEDFWCLHSRYTHNSIEDIQDIDGLEVFADSEKAGLLLAVSKGYKQIFLSGHLEYDRNTMKEEYLRDREVDSETQLPENYFTDDDIYKEIEMEWKSTSSLFFSNWINYCVYQMTPYEL